MRQVARLGPADRFAFATQYDRGLRNFDLGFVTKTQPVQAVARVILFMHLHHALVRATTLLGTTVLAAFVVAVVWWYQCQQLNPQTADRERLFQWLLTYDLNEVSPQTRCLLAERLDKQCSDEIDWQELRQRLTAERRARLWNNMPLLLEPWFMAKVDRYHRCDASDRMAFLDRMIDTLSGWKGLDRLCPRPDPSDEGPSSLKALLFEQIDVWRSRAKPDQRKRIDALVTAVELRWLFRQLAGTLDGPTSPPPNSAAK